MRKLTRREVLAVMATATAAPASALLAQGALPRAPQRSSGSPCSPPLPRSPLSPYVFFDAAEALFIESACERLIPADPSGPGALAAGVPSYLDRQLAGEWGDGRHLYRHGPWQAGSPAQGGPGSPAPAQLFRTALRAARRDLLERGTPYGLPFQELRPSLQSAYLEGLAAGHADLDGVPSSLFFNTLLVLTVEGFFSNPHGVTRDRVAWSMYGFPGAHAARAASPDSA